MAQFKPQFPEFEVSDEAAAALLRLIGDTRVDAIFHTKTNQEIARLLLEYVWAYIPSGTATAKLIDEAITRLAPELTEGDDTTEGRAP